MSSPTGVKLALNLGHVDAYRAKVCPESEARNSDLGKVCPESEARNSDLGKVCPESGARNSDLGKVCPESEARNSDLGKVCPESEACFYPLCISLPRNSGKVF